MVNDRGDDSTIPPPWEMARKRPNLSSTGEPWRVAAEFPGDFHHEQMGRSHGRLGPIYMLYVYIYMYDMKIYEALFSSIVISMIHG